MSEVSLVDGHIDNRLTDKEIVGNLNEIVHLYAKDTATTVKGIPLIAFLGDVLDLINRYKAENEKLNIEIKAMRGAANSYKAEVERLKKENEILSENADTAFQDGLNEAQDLYANQIKYEIESEAIKNFAELVKDLFASEDDVRTEIDNLVIGYGDESKLNVTNAGIANSQDFTPDVIEGLLKEVKKINYNGKHIILGNQSVLQKLDMNELPDYCYFISIYDMKPDELLLVTDSDLKEMLYPFIENNPDKVLRGKQTRGGSEK